jgi:hypothetical protein
MVSAGQPVVRDGHRVVGLTNIDTNLKIGEICDPDWLGPGLLTSDCVRPGKSKNSVEVNTMSALV